MGRECSTHGEDVKYIQNSVRNPERRRSFERPKHRWEGNFEMDLKGNRCEGMNWIHVSLEGFQPAHVNNDNESSGPIKWEKFLHQLNYCQVLRKDSAL
jgi:hypothetical protein